MRVTVGIRQNGPTDRIAVVANVLLRFRNGSRRWIDVKHFESPVAMSDIELLGALLAHVQFRDGYVGSGPDAGQNVHGRFVLDAITTESYQRIAPAHARDWLDDFCALDDALPAADLAADIDAVVRQRLTEAGSIYRLAEMPDSQHEFAWILREFRELVIIHGGGTTLSLIVMGID